MVFSEILLPGRGTKLYKNQEINQTIEICTKRGKSKTLLFELLVIMGKKSFFMKKENLKNSFRIKIGSKLQYMIINLGLLPVELTFSQSPESHEIIYDPYYFEDKKHLNVDPDEFKAVHLVPEGYINALPKWYSVKYTYKDYNLIFVRPSMGISIQTHKMREEHWKILRGNPIIITGNQVYYNAAPREIFKIPVGTIHTIINPTDKWILIKEKYKGKFDEEDIIRIFNPNHYK
ncbi:MAG: hypothetical protein ACTSWY_00980 [Promethearchaeota archaeon]